MVVVQLWLGQKQMERERRHGHEWGQFEPRSHDRYILANLQREQNPADGPPPVTWARRDKHLVRLRERLNCHARVESATHMQRDRASQMEPFVGGPEADRGSPGGPRVSASVVVVNPKRKSTCNNPTIPAPRILPRRLSIFYCPLFPSPSLSHQTPTSPCFYPLS